MSRNSALEWKSNRKLRAVSKRRYPIKNRAKIFETGIQPPVDGPGPVHPELHVQFSFLLYGDLHISSSWEWPDLVSSHNGFPSRFDCAPHGSTQSSACITSPVVTEGACFALHFQPVAVCRKGFRWELGKLPSVVRSKFSGYKGWLLGKIRVNRPLFLVEKQVFSPLFSEKLFAPIFFWKWKL